MGGASEEQAECEAAGGGREERGERDREREREEGWGCCYRGSKCFCATHPGTGRQVKAVFMHYFLEKSNLGSSIFQAFSIKAI